MGQVFLGRSATGALAAVKVIRPELAGEPGFRERFAREVAAAANVSGRFTALVLDADVQSATPWLATAYVSGPSLAEAVTAEGPLPVPAVLSLAAGLAQGLGAIHAAGLVHRDLKPANVLLADDGPRVIDFGISRSREASMLTQAGMVVGSPGFMSPEQAIGRWVGPASDVFSLGAVLAFAATATHPFGTGTPPMLMYRVVHEDPDLAGVPGPLRPVVGWCLAKDPGQRPGTAELLTRLGAAPRAAASANRHRAPAGSRVTAAARAVGAGGAAVPAPRLPDIVGSGPLLAAPVGPAPMMAAPAGPAPMMAGTAGPAQLMGAPGEAAPWAAAPAPAGRTPAGRASAGREGAGLWSAGLAPTEQVPAAGPGGSRAAADGSRAPAGARPTGRAGLARGMRASRQRTRRRLAWAGALAGLMVAVTATVVLLPGALRGAAAAQPRPDFRAGPAPATSAAARSQAVAPAVRPRAPALAAPSLAAGAPASPASPSPSPSPSASATSSSPPAAASPSPGPGGQAPLLPEILTATTYTVGRLVSFSLTYADPGHDAAGFGFVGVNGTSWPVQIRPFSSLAGGFVSVGTVAYSFDLGCGTVEPSQGSVAVWLYDTAGRRSQPVTIALTCAG